jgi:hypothetical protein
MPVDGFIVNVAEAVADRMTATGLSGEQLRERQHLDPFFKDEIERRTGVRPLSSTLRTPDFPGLGPVDVIVNEPRALIELKWSYARPDKIFESVWDAIKLALLGPAHGCDNLYIATGASVSAWAASESADLFAGDEIDPAEMWDRPLVPPRGPNYGRTVGEDLVIGARGNQPMRVPEAITVLRLGSFLVAQGYELRVIGVGAAGLSLNGRRRS